MKYYEWKKRIIESYIKNKRSEMQQFGIQEIDSTTDIGKKLVCSNIFGTNNNDRLKSIADSNENTAIIVGFGGNDELHLGHLLLANELNFYLKNIKKPKFYFVNFESENNKKFVTKIKNLSAIYDYDMKYEIIDYKNLEALKLKKKIAKSLNINEVNRVMGWKNEKIHSYEKVLDMLTTFALGNILPEKQSIILTDINQKTYYALYKKIENKVNNINACFVYHLLMPSLKSPSERMSVKNTKSLIQLNDNLEEIEKKLKKSYSGVEDKEITCFILRTADLVLTNNETIVLVNNCINNLSYCKYCKENNIEKISNEIHKRKIRK